MSSWRHAAGGQAIREAIAAGAAVPQRHPAPLHGLRGECRKNRDNFLSSGFPGLDRLLGGGFIRGGLYILGARPAVGKTTFALNLADNMAGNTLLVSLEMSPEQLTAKRVSGLTGYPAAPAAVRRPGGRGPGVGGRGHGGHRPGPEGGLCEQPV